MVFSTSVPLGDLVLLVVSDVVCLFVVVTLAHEQLRSNFKVEIRGVLNTKLTHIFCVSPCVSPLHD